MRINRRFALAGLGLVAIALCWPQAASAGVRLVQALRSGILVLVIPPMFMSVGITVLAYRKRNQFRSDDNPDE
jgi:secreted protein with Ig-like and vWFA domain